MTMVIVTAVTVTALVALILERFRRAHVRETMRGTGRVRFGHALAEGLVADDAVDEALRLLLPDHADWCVLHLLDGARVRRAAVVHVDRDIEDGLRATFQRVPFVGDAHAGPAQVIRTGQAELGACVNPDLLDRQPELGIFRRAGAGGFISVPIKDRRDTVGALTLHSRVPGAYDQRDLDWAQDVGYRIGLSIENRRLYLEARQLFEQSVSANFVAAADGTILACNERFAALLGFASVDDARTTPFHSLYADPEAPAALLEQLRRDRRVAGREIDLRHRAGHIVTVVAEAAGDFDDAGGLLRTRGFLIDRTGHKDLEEQLRQAHRLEAVGQLAGGIAHDFNNLLTVIIGCADLMKLDNGSTVVDGHDPLDELTKAARRAATLTHQLLAFSRRQLLQPREVQLNDAVRSVHSLLRRLAPHHVVLVLDLDTAVKSVQVDPGQLDQVLVNLVVNSADAMPDGGTITVSTANVPQTWTDVQQPDVTPGDYVSLTVTDTGNGMDEGTRARVFEPFFTTKPVGKGTGLGLSTVYGIVKQSGGFVRIASAPGAGTAVTVCLPAAVTAPPREPAPC